MRRTFIQDELLTADYTLPEAARRTVAKRGIRAIAFRGPSNSMAMEALEPGRMSFGSKHSIQWE